jgi:hypothetical protein
LRHEVAAPSIHTKVDQDILPKSKQSPPIFLIGCNYSVVAELLKAWRSFAAFEERAAQLTCWSMSSAATKKGAKLRQDLSSYIWFFSLVHGQGKP